jgi:hypothetical protein
MTKLGFTPDEKDLCYSIFKGIFDPKNKTSIKSIQNNYKYNVKN